MKRPCPVRISDLRRIAAAGLAGLALFAAPRAGAQTVYTWNSGDIVTGSITPTTVSTVGPADMLNITTGNDHDFNGALLTNNGTVNWTNGNLRSGNGGTFTNNATWNDSVAANQINNAYGGAGGTTFVNAATGTYNKTAGTTDFTVGFTNAGKINVTGGTLNLDAGGSFADGSVVGSSGSGVLQLLGGTLVMNGNITATNFLFNGGTLAGNQNFVGSTLNWQNGDWNSANTTSLSSNTTLNLISGNDHNFNGHTIVNNGTINWTNGNLRSGNGGILTNNAVWNDTVAGNQINNAYGGAGGTTFVNSAGATYNKISGTTDFTIGFTNAGTINVTGGTLNLDAGGTFADGSVITSSGPGLVQLLGGTLVMTGNITTSNFLFNGGTLAGDQTFTNSVLNWQNGDWNSANTTILASTTTLNLISGNDHNFNSHTIVNNGTVNWTSGNIRSGNGGILTNNAVWNDTVANNQVNNAYGGAGGTTFVNSAGATYNKTAGTTDFWIGFTNYGNVVVSGGTLNLDAGGTFYGGSAIGSTGTGVVQLTGGTLTGGGGGVFTATNFLLTGGTLTGDITFLGTTNWVASDFNTPTGTATIGATGILNITSGNDHNFNSHAIVNNGTVNWTDGNIRAGNGGVLTNNATWNDTVANNQVNDAYGGAGGTTFHNAVTGVYNKTAGTTLLANGVLVNDGTINVTGGVLNLDGGTLDSGSTIGSSGAGTVQLVSGGLTINGTVNLQNFAFSGGQLLGSQTFAGTATWLASDFNTAGTTTIGGGTTLTIDSGNDHNLNSRAIVNLGTIDWLNGNIRSGNSGIITNASVWNDSVGNNQINNAYGGTGGTTFLNAGGAVYNKTAGTTLLANGVLVNDGTINVSGGTLNLDGGTLDNGSTLAGSGGTVQLVSGALFANGLVNVQNFLLNGGQLNGVQTFAGSLTWLTTDLNTGGTTTVGLSGLLAIDSGNDHNFSSRAIVNSGVVDWINGNLRSGNGGTITNYGVWNDSVGNNQINNAYGGAGGTTFINAAGGEYLKAGGTTTFFVPMVNLGTVDLTAGTLALTAGYSDTAGTLALATGTSLSSTSSLALSTGSFLTGTGTLVAPSFAISGGIKPGTLTSTGQLTLNGNLTLQGPAFANFEIGGVTQGTQYDYLAVNGSAGLGGNLQIGFINGFETTINSSMTFDLISSTALSGSFLDVANGSRLTTADGLGSFVVNYGPGSAFGVNDVVLSSFAPVPEASTWALLIAGTGLLGLVMRRRRRA